MEPARGSCHRACRLKQWGGAPRENGGKRHSLPCHHNPDHYLDLEAYKGPLFRTAADQSWNALTSVCLWQEDDCRMIQRRAKAAGIRTKIVNYAFRATGITAYLKKGDKLETAPISNVP